jgi:hypothetical protein
MVGRVEMGSSGAGLGPEAGSCDYGNEYSGSIESG